MLYGHLFFELGPPIIFNCIRKTPQLEHQFEWENFSVENSPEIVDLQIQSKQQSPAFSYS